MFGQVQSDESLDQIALLNRYFNLMKSPLNNMQLKENPTNGEDATALPFAQGANNSLR